jgi:hypothetical protein
MLLELNRSVNTSILPPRLGAFLDPAVNPVPIIKPVWVALSLNNWILNIAKLL